MVSDLDHADSTLGGRYALGELLGRGGMGEIRAGRDLRLGREVAVKLLNPGMAGQAGVKERFQAEARAAAMLNHPNAVAVYDSGEHQGVPYLVMERLPGRTLADELVEGPLDPERARRLGGEVLAALEAAHRAGIVHRDIKPGNVLLCPDGRAKIGDFGIAKTLEGMNLTTTGMLVGTPGYLAPERVAGQPATPRSDLYSVGVLLYEALSGVKPFSADSPIAMAHAIQNQDPTPLSELRPGMPAGLVAAIERAMAKEPGRRFGSAAEMARALLEESAPADTSAIAPTRRLGSTRPFGPVTGRLTWRTRERIAPRGRSRVTAIVGARPVVPPSWWRRSSCWGLCSAGATNPLGHRQTGGRPRSSRRQPGAVCRRPGTFLGQARRGGPPVSRLVIPACVALLLALLVSGCGSDEGLGQRASQRLTPPVHAVRVAAASGDPDTARQKLAELRQTVAELRGAGQLSEAAAARVLAAATEVEVQLQSLPPPTTLPSSLRGGGGDGGGGTATTKKGDSKEKGKDEEKEEDDG